MELTTQQLNLWMTTWAETVAANVDHLNEIDTAVGDGDHGSNLHRGTQATVAALDAEASVAQSYRNIAMALVSSIGGASGALYGTAFLRMANLAKDGNMRLEELLLAATEAMKVRGHSDIGMKTLIDLWAPATTALANHQLDAQVLDQAVAATAPMMAKKGRSSYLKQRSVGHIDPVAQSSAYLFHALLGVIDADAA